MNLCIAIVGPTASGKSAFAIELAKKISGEIVCMDSTTIYRGLDVGTSKPTADQRALVPHHLLDILSPEEPFSAFHFVQRASGIIAEIHERKKFPIVVGGTYFYLRALQHGMYPQAFIPDGLIEEIEKEYFEDEKLNTLLMHEALKRLDPEAAETIHPNDRYRLLRAIAILRASDILPSRLKPVVEPASSKRLWLKYGIVVSRHALNQNIVHRTEKMLSNGWVEEARGLFEKHPQTRCLQCIGYAQIGLHLKNKLTFKQLRNEIIERTRQLAKRQVTWLRSDEELRFIDGRDLPRVALEIENLCFALEAS